MKFKWQKFTQRNTAVYVIPKVSLPANSWGADTYVAEKHHNLVHISSANIGQSVLSYTHNYPCHIYLQPTVMKLSMNKVPNATEKASLTLEKKKFTTNLFAFYII